MKEALLDREYNWRSIDRLADIVGVSVNDDEDILRKNPMLFSVSVNSDAASPS